MENSQRPPELDPIERMLTSGPRPFPSEELRRRVSDSVRAELRKNMFDVIRMELRRNNIRSKWRFAAAFAATIAVCLIITLGVMRETRHSLRQSQSPQTLDDVAWRLQQISPELSKEESLIQASLRQIGTNAESSTTLGDILGLGSFGFTAKPKPAAPTKTNHK
jgi:hypothetical protein